MNNIIQKIDKFFVKLQEYILIISSVTICMLIFTAAFARYILKVDFYGSEEIIMLAAFWLYFIGSSLAEREDSHINADMVGVFIKNEKIKKIISILKYCISLAISITVTYWSYEYILRSLTLHPTTPVLKMPLIYTQIPVLISFILMDIYLFSHIIRVISNKNKTAGGKYPC